MTDQHVEIEKKEIQAIKKGLKVAFIIITVLVIIIAILKFFGHQNRQYNKNASDAYQKAVILNKDPNADNSIIIKKYREVAKNYPKSTYATFSSWKEAKYNVDNNELDNAITTLKNNLKYQKDKALNAITKLRIARVEISQNKINEAINTINSVKEKGVEIYKEILLGNAYKAKKNKTQAVEHWHIALNNAISPDISSLLQNKINNA